VAALLYLGRGSGLTLADGHNEIRHIDQNHLVGVLSSKSQLATHIRTGLQKLGFTLEAKERRRVNRRKTHPTSLA